jgi:hypothetical protein
MLPIEEKQLKTLIAANDNMEVTFQILGDTKKNECALLITVPGGAEHKTFVLFSTIGKAVRRFKDLDRGITFLQEIMPQVHNIRIEVNPMDEIPVIERRKKPRE